MSCPEGSWVCPCDRWLCMDSGDGRIERELHPLHSPQDKGASSQWTVHVWTSDLRGAGTDANVTIQVHLLCTLTVIMQAHSNTPYFYLLYECVL